MNALKLPFWAMWPKDWLASMDILKMNAAEEGGYIRLLNLDWMNDGLPDDDNLLAEFSRLGDAWFNGAAQKIRPLFAPVRMKPSLITSVMLQQIRDEHVKFMEARRKGGEASGRKRKGNSDLMRALVAKRWCEQDTNKDTNKDTNAYEPPTPSPSTGTEERKRAQEDSESSSGGDVKVPTLAEVLEWGKIDGYPEEVCRDFYDFEAGLGWMHGNTRIRDPRRWLKRYFNRSRGPKRAPRAASLLWQSKTRLDQLKSMWEAHPGHPKNAYETPATSEELEEFEKITAEMKQLQRQIALGEQPSTNA